MKCVICGKKIFGYPNNAMPVARGPCCNECNWTVVIPARIRSMLSSVNQAEVKP
jgi:DNA-directed RNA polymerase subunit RPC12/RpoP